VDLEWYSNAPVLEIVFLVFVSYKQIISCFRVVNDEGRKYYKIVDLRVWRKYHYLKKLSLVVYCFIWYGENAIN